MTMQGVAASIGFVALWNKTDAEYRASASDEWATTARIQGAFKASRERGNVSAGLFASRLGSPYAYMTFWHCPDALSLVDSIADLERAGDFKFADSYHVFGARISGSCSTVMRVPGDARADHGLVAPTGLFVQWNVSARPDRAAAEYEVLEVLATDGCELAGAYDSRLSSSWERFAFAIAAEASLEQVMNDLRRVADRRGVVMRTLVGQLDRNYRFASHIQGERPWLDSDENR